MTRRVFISNGARSLVAMGVPPAFLTRSLAAGTATGRRRTLVCIFQRGAVDGLNMVVPFGDPAYSASRRSIAVPAPRRGRTDAALDLDGFFGLHPALAPLHELWRRRELAIVHAVGSPHPTRSHFEAQEYMETAMPGERSREGWLNRVLQHTPCPGCTGRTPADRAAHAADQAAGRMALGAVPFRGVALSRALPLAMRGRHAALALGGLAIDSTAGPRAAAMAAAGRLYRTRQDDPIAAAGAEALDAVARLRAVTSKRSRVRAGAQYPDGELGRALRQIAQLVNADVGLEIVFADSGGWDTHASQGGVTGPLADRLRELAQALRAFYDDLGDRAGETVVLTMSEFGRTVRENGSGGTDYGHANCMLVLGGTVRGGQVAGRWPGLEREQLHEGRDLARTTDFRDVFGEIATNHLRATRLDRVFPGYEADPRRVPGVLGPGA